MTWVVDGRETSFLGWQIVYFLFVVGLFGSGKNLSMN
jgi:hypothetical protein